ncbi:putative GEM-like protein 8 [Rutidosis leptorrhynchoides]|uniref:putative GEM-like protein 8 n=1 Tax=Rutidosis leptorrhynchoides TaxID=125765 RepID=UPI003A99E874
MDSRFSSKVMGFSIVSTGGLLLSKPYQPLLTLSSSSKNNGVDRKVNLGPILIEIMKNKLSFGAKKFPIGREGTIFSKRFRTTNNEKLLHATRCYIYTIAGAIAGSLFVSSERVGFCSDKSLKTYSATGEMLKFQYKVSIPLGKIKGIGESMNVKKPSNKYVEFVTLDDFSFWFWGFSDYKKTLRYLRQTISHNCLSN